MPLHVAVEHPDTGVIGAEADDGVAVVLDHDGVAFDWGCGDVACQALVEAAVNWGALQNLEVVSVQVPWVQVVVVVVDDYLDDFVVLHHEGVDLAIYFGVGRELGSHCVGSVQRWNLGGDIGLAVDSETWKTVHEPATGIQNDLAVHGLQQGLVVGGYQKDIIHKVSVGVDAMEDRRRGQRLRLVVHQPGRGVGVEVLRDGAILIDKHHVDIHGIPDSKVLASVRLSMDQDTHTLTSGNTQELVSRRVRFSIDTVNRYDSHFVAIEHPEVARPVSKTDDVDQVRLVGQNLDLGVG